jgi:endoglucanase
VSDEFIWAACELYSTTKDAQYIMGDVNVLPETKVQLPSWGQVRMLGYYTLLRTKTPLLGDRDSLVRIEKIVLQFSEDLMKDYNKRSFSMVMGATARDYVWGSTAVAANQSIALIYAYKISRDKKYLDAALTNLDFLLGRNGTGYSFVTGYGDKTPMHPHHRPSVADGIVDPVPGLLAGGPNPGRQDGCAYPSTVTDEAYVDTDCSYASNEIAINWNAPLVYLTCAFEALQGEDGYLK